MKMGQVGLACLLAQSCCALSFSRQRLTLRAAAVTDANAVEERAKFDKVVQYTYGRYPVTIDRGVGCELFDDGADRRYLDFVAGIATCCLGHADARMVAAVTRQISRVHHVSNLYYIPEQGQLAAWLVERTRGLDRAFFCNSGGEANEAAIKLSLKRYALAHPGGAKPVVLTAYGSFHGRTIATISATAQPKYHGPDGCWHLADMFDHFEYNDAASLKAAFEKHAGRVAAVLIEPVQGEGGVRSGDAAFFTELRAMCDEHSALLMLDEVQAGVGRTGKLWAHEHFPGLVPDVLTCAKAIGGGVPLGAMLCSAAADVFVPGDHATTYGGNPLACAAGLAVAKAIDDDGLIENAAARGAQLLAGLQKLAAERADLVVEARGRGLLIGVELHADAPTASEVVAACAERGLLLVPAGYSVVRFVPPLVVTQAQIDEALTIFQQALQTFPAKQA